MPVFSLNQQIFFPPPHMANPDGILAIGGDLEPERLLLAYEMGIFPWYSEDEPIIWWSPDPRCILDIKELKISKSMKQIMRNRGFRFSFDQAFMEVLNHCRTIERKDQQGTWITDDISRAYQQLHEMGYAHSTEVWQGDELVGGLYGVSLGKGFFGESMFSKVSNASKAALIHLTSCLETKGFTWLDCQVYNGHLGRLGAKNIPRPEFLQRLEEAVGHATIQGNWEICLKEGEGK
ncbi:MAG: leucyl/phenylalanyl-tRNA--protein transferase [Bacteroidota bacterium]